MKITPKQYATALYDLVKDKKSGEVKKVIEDFVRVLILNNDISKTEKIINEFSIMWNKVEGVVDAEIVSASDLGKQIVKLLNDYIFKLTGAKKIEMKENIDKNILGGIVVKYGDKVIDGSLKTRIYELKNKMTK